MVYEVIHVTDTYNTEDCRLVCRECNICIHNYTCECSDHIIKLNICKHIHACAILSSVSSNTQNNLCETTEIPFPGVHPPFSIFSVYVKNV